MKEIHIANERDIMLLSAKEYYSAHKHVPAVDDDWWLRSPGYMNRYGTFVDCNDGHAYDYLSVNLMLGIRPALKLGPESGNFQIGEKVRAAGHTWTVIPGDMALCDEIIGWTPFHEDLLAPEANDYEKSDVKKQLEHWALEKALVIPSLQPDAITGITLPSTEEFEAAQEYVPQTHGPWWLRSPGYGSGNAAVVDEGGLVHEPGYSVGSPSAFVRPALRLDPESGNFQIGEKVRAAGLTWTVIPGDMALCDKIVGETAFREDPKAPDANVYEASDVRKYLEGWAREKGLIQQESIVLHAENTAREKEGKMTKEELSEVLERHYMWVEHEMGGQRADLSGKDLSGMDLSGANLRGAVLSGANLRGSDLYAADLSGADLTGADLRGANLGNAGLHSACLREALLDGAGLEGADLSKADLAGTDLHEARFGEWREEDRNTDLSGANLTGANLSGLKLDRANLQGTVMNGAHMEGASLPMANMFNTKLEGAALSGANLRNALLMDAALKKADLTGACLRGAAMPGADLSQAKLCHADLRHAQLVRAGLEGADLSGANLTDAKLHGADLSGAAFTDTDLALAEFQGAKGAEKEQLEAGKNMGRAILYGVTLAPSAELAKTVRAEASVEAEYGDVCVEGSIATLAHHGPRSANPAPCNADVKPLPIGSTILVSHIDLDTVGGIMALEGKKPDDPEFWKAAEYIDLNGPHRIHSLPQGIQDKLNAYYAAEYAARKEEGFPPRDAVSDVTDAAGKRMEAVEAILDERHPMHDAAIRAGQEWERGITEAVEKQHVYDTENVRVFITDGPFTAGSYYSPVDDEVKKATATLNTKTGAITVAFEDGGKPGKSARAVVQGLWGPEAGGRDGIAGSPRGMKMVPRDLLDAAMKMEEAAVPAISTDRLDDLKGMRQGLAEAVREAAKERGLEAKGIDARQDAPSL